MQYKRIVIKETIKEKDVIEVEYDRLVEFTSKTKISSGEKTLLAVRNWGNFYNKALGVNRNYDCAVGTDENGYTIIVLTKKEV